MQTDLISNIYNSRKMTIVFDAKTRTVTYDIPKALEHIATLLLEAPEWEIIHPKENEEIPIQTIT